MEEALTEVLVKQTQLQARLFELQSRQKDLRQMIRAAELELAHVTGQAAGLQRLAAEPTATGS